MTPTTAAFAPLVDALTAQPLTDVPVVVLQEQIAALTPLVGRLDGWLSAAAAQVLAASGGTVPRADGSAQTVAAWLADLQQSTPSAAGRALRTSSALRDLPLLSEAVLDGRLTPEKAAVLARLVGRIDADALLAMQPQLLLVAAACDPAELAAYVRHQIATHCEPALEADEQRGQDRWLWQHTRDADGTLRGRLVLSAEDSEPVLTVLEALARKQSDTDLRSAAQRRADALVDVFGQVLRHGDLPDAGGQRPQLAYVVPAHWAARNAKAEACTARGLRCPAHRPLRFADTVTADLAGTGTDGPATSGSGKGIPTAKACATAAWSGPQTRSRIEALLCDARITRVLLDPTGQVARLEALTDSITTAQRRALAARDQGCAARHCTRPAAVCDAHHLTHREHGGPTTLDNLVLLCRRHHVLWHLGRLTLRQLVVPWLDQPPARDWADLLANA